MLQFNCILVPRILLMCIYSIACVCVWQAWEVCVAIHIIETIRASVKDISAAVRWYYCRARNCSHESTSRPSTLVVIVKSQLENMHKQPNAYSTCTDNTSFELSTVVLTAYLQHKSPEIHFRKLNTINCHKGRHTCPQDQVPQSTDEMHATYHLAGLCGLE